MNNHNTKIVYSHSEDNWDYASEDLDEAIESMIEDIVCCDNYIDSGWHVIYSGECVRLKFTDLIDIGHVLECADEVEYDCFQDLDKTTDYETNVTPKQIEELDRLIQMWADKHKLNPKYTMIKNVKTVKVFVTEEMVKAVMDDEI